MITLRLSHGCLLPGEQAGALDAVFNLTEPFIAPRFLNELAGLAAGSHLDVAMFRRISMLGELTKMGCSIIGAW